MIASDGKRKSLIKKYLRELYEKYNNKEIRLKELLDAKSKVCKPQFCRDNNSALREYIANQGLAQEEYEQQHPEMSKGESIITLILLMLFIGFLIYQGATP